MNLKRFFFIILVCAACSQAQTANHPSTSVSGVKPPKLFHRAYTSIGTLNRPALVLVLHGDAPFSKPSYQYAIARKIAKENKNVVAVGILRPGYTDNEGNRSEGERGNTSGDNYTKEVLSSINSLANQLKKKYNPSKVILVGHSGGAAISANLIAEYANSYNAALLVSCPCDLHPWRKHMKTLQPNTSIWDAKVSSLSPIEQVKRIDNDTQIGVINGTNDRTIPLHIVRKYVKALEANHKKVKFVLLKNQGHRIAFNPKVFEMVKELIQ